MPVVSSYLKITGQAWTANKSSYSNYKYSRKPRILLLHNFLPAAQSATHQIFSLYKLVLYYGIFNECDWILIQGIQTAEKTYFH